MKWGFLALLLVVLTGCLSMRPEEIRALPGEHYESTASVDGAVRCMRTRGADYINVTTYPESGEAEFTVETYQMMSVRIVYMASVARRDGGGTNVSAKFSGQNSWSLSESGFRDLLAQCMPRIKG